MSRFSARFTARPRKAMLAALVLMLVPVVAWAHHGWREYGSETFELTGTIEAVSLGPPHAYLLMRDSDDNVWEIVLGPPARNDRAGITDENVLSGDTATAIGRRHTDPGTYEMKTERLVIGDQVYDIYPERLGS